MCPGSVLASIYNSMNERRRQIALLRALGARRRTVAATVLLEAVAIALIGVVLGFAVYLAILGRGVVTVLLAAALVTLLLLVTFDLDRPTRGLIRIPSAPLTSLRASMLLPPAAGGASHR